MSVPKFEMLAKIRGVKKIKRGIFLDEIKKLKTWGSPHLQFGEHHVLVFFIFYKKYTTFDFFLHRMVLSKYTELELNLE